MNLASLDPHVATRSLEQARTALRWAGELGSRWYSVHAGYLVDPAPNELGAALHTRALFDRHEASARFTERVAALADQAKSAGIRLLIENNVLSARNHDRFGCNPLLMVDPDETDAMMREMPADVGLLVDVGHVKVSAAALGFAPEAYLVRCARWIRGAHLSDNDGREDSNQPIAAGSWFWDALPPALDYCSVEVYKSDARTLADQQELAARMLARSAQVAGA